MNWGPAWLALFAGLGALAGVAVNWATYELAYFARPISPWSRQRRARPAPGARVPIFGWLWLRAETPQHGRGFWVRPLLVELGLALAFPAIAWWELSKLALLPPDAVALAGLERQLVWHVLAHWLLLSLMLAASLVDLDEKTIPDGVTVSGTLLGLALLAWHPEGFLPQVRLQQGLPQLSTVDLVAGADWPPALMARTPRALLVALGVYWAWCFALLPRVWRGRRGWRWAWRIFCAHLQRDRFSYLVALLALLGAPALGGAWWFGGAAWQGLLTALVGLGAGGALVWLVRLLGRWALGREAMGFGDVTLLAMIGAYLGWQAVIVVFFLAPFAGLLLGLLQLATRGDREIPYGPFLCLAAEAVVLCWHPVWQGVRPYFEVPWLVPTVLGCCLALLVVPVGIWRGLSEWARRPS